MTALTTPCLVLDTNVWLSKSYLAMSTPLAASLLFSLRRRGGALGMPEVLEIELLRNLQDEAARLLGEYEDIRDRLLRLGILDEPSLRLPTDPIPPDEAVARERIVQRLKSLADLFVRVPFTEKQARMALARVAAGSPPNGPKNQQFKDSAIWEAVLELGASTPVVFVTADNAFFKDRDPRNGLAPNLARDAESAAYAVSVRHMVAMPEMLRQLQGESPPIDRDHVLGRVLSEAIPLVAQDGDAHGYSVDESDVTGGGTVFVTAEPAVVSLSFNFLFNVVGTTLETEGRGKLNVDGQATYNVDSDEVGRVLITDEWLHRDDKGSVSSWTPVPITPEAAAKRPPDLHDFDFLPLVAESRQDQEPNKESAGGTT